MNDNSPRPHAQNLNRMQSLKPIGLGVSQSDMWGIKQPLFNLSRAKETGLPQPSVFPRSNANHAVKQHQLATVEQTPFNSFSPFLPRTGLDKSSPAEGVLADELISEKQHNAEEVIADVKQQLEALICAVMLTSQNPKETLDASVMQGADAIEVSHRLMTRMKMLRDENKRLYKLANGTTLAQMEATIARLEKENAALRKITNEYALK